jgi:D-glycero-beta-D-manno-heptose 1-phosphate adenylyltransferase
MKINEMISEKFFHDMSEISQKLAYWHFKNKKIVFTNGCFDIVHKGHIDYLAKSADQGDILIIGLNTDASVKVLKGENRPIIDQNSRGLLLASLLFVDAVVLFKEQTPEKIIEFIKPDILIKGSDYHPEDIVGYEFVKKNNGNVVTIDFLEGYSTSKIIQKIVASQ